MMDNFELNNVVLMTVGLVFFFELTSLSKMKTYEGNENDYTSSRDQDPY